MGLYDEEIAADAAEVLGEVGRTVSYSPGGAGPTEINAKVGPEEVVQEDDDDGAALVRRRTLAALPSVLTDPSNEDSVTIDDVVYGVRSFTTSGLFVQLVLESREPLRIGGRRSRIERR